MTGEGYAVILVHSTSHAIHLEKLLGKRGVVCKMIPVPRQLSSDCGVCIRVPRTRLEAAREAVEASKIDVQGIVHI
jgi:hypothetical protein